MENAGRRKNIWNDDWKNKNRVAAIITRGRGLIKIESGLIRIISRISLNEMERAHTFAISRGEGKIDVSANYIPLHRAIISCLMPNSNSNGWNKRDDS